MSDDIKNLAPINSRESEIEVLNAFVTDSNSLNDYIDILKPIHFYNSFISSYIKEYAIIIKRISLLM